jgi:hypothetical protein
MQRYNPQGYFQQATTVVNDAIWDAAGDIAVGSNPNTATRLPKGNDDQFLGVNGGNVQWITPTTWSETVVIDGGSA